MESRLLSLLNSCNSGNLAPQDQHELGELVGEYFTADHRVDDGWDSSDSEEDEEEMPEIDGDFDHTEEEIDQPIVIVDVGVGKNGDECESMTGDIGVNSLLVKARQRSCKANGHGCVQIKVAKPGPDEQRRGCITQFSPEEITALQHSVLDMGKGEYFIFNLYY